MLRPQSLSIAATIIVAYLATFLLVHYLIFPLQSAFSPDTAKFAALIFLPHGVRVIATWLYREKALLPLIAAHLLLYRLFYWHGDNQAANMVAVLSGSFCVFLALQMFNFSRIDISLHNPSVSHWRSLVFLGFVSSIFNSLGNMLALGSSMASEIHISVWLTFIIGDTLGVLACMILLMLYFRYRRLLGEK